MNESNDCPPQECELKDEEHCQTSNDKKQLYLTVACKICSQHFLKESELTEHMVVHVSDQAISSDPCDRSFEKQSHYQQQHLVKSGVDLYYPCHLCCKSFSSNASLKSHYRDHLGIKQHTCNLCHQSFSKKSLLKSHYEAIHDRESPLSCKECQDLFPDVNSLSEHCLKHKQKFHVCDVCNKSYSTNKILNRHKKVHTDSKAFECNICYLSLSSSSSLKKHYLMHARENLYSCSICNQVFFSADSLKEHDLTHSGEKPVCSICFRQFANSKGLHIHYAAHHSKELCIEYHPG